VTAFIEPAAPSVNSSPQATTLLPRLLRLRAKGRGYRGLLRYGNLMSSDLQGGNTEQDDRHHAADTDSPP